MIEDYPSQGLSALLDEEIVIVTRHLDWREYWYGDDVNKFPIEASKPERSCRDPIPRVGVCALIDNPPEEFVWIRSALSCNDKTLFCIHEDQVIYKSRVAMEHTSEQCCVVIDVEQNVWMRSYEEYSMWQIFYPSNETCSALNIPLYSYAIVLDRVLGSSSFSSDIASMF